MPSDPSITPQPNGAPRPDPGLPTVTPPSGSMFLRLFGVPALIVWGEQDRFAGVKMAKRFRQEIPGSQLVLFKDAGHFVWIEAPGSVRRALDRLADQVSARLDP